MPAGRHRRCVATVLTAGAALAESARLARRGGVDPLETRAFRACNRAPDLIATPAWLLMQSGSLAAVPVTSGCLALRRRPSQALAAAVAGTAVWAGVKAVKPFVGRGRPADELAGGDAPVVVRGSAQRGLGYPSGHAAVALTLGLVAASRSRRTAGAAVALAAMTGMTRMYVGAHLPLDVVGGLAIGALGGTAGAAWARRVDRGAGS
jgi:membrane-associated phospholipid phosphatase